MEANLHSSAAQLLPSVEGRPYRFEPQRPFRCVNSRCEVCVRSSSRSPGFEPQLLSSKLGRTERSGNSFLLLPTGGDFSASLPRLPESCGVWSRKCRGTKPSGLVGQSTTTAHAGVAETGLSPDPLLRTRGCGFALPLQGSVGTAGTQARGRGQRPGRADALARV